MVPPSAQFDSSPETSLTVAPRGLFLRALQGWWLLCLCILAGSLVGLGLERAAPPLYESRFGIQVGYDYTNTGELSQYQEDVAYELAGQVLYKPAMLARVAQEAQKESLPIDAAQLKNMSTVERRLGTWLVRVRSRDPQTAERLAGIWLNFGVEELRAARQHALVADGLMRRQEGLENCLAQAALAEPSAGLCSPQDIKDLQKQLAESSPLLAQERALSQGIPSGVVFGEMPTAPEPAYIVAFQRGQRVLGGGLIGLVIGVWAVQADWASRLAIRFRRRRLG
jgi:hypothetical protein